MSEATDAADGNTGYYRAPDLTVTIEINDTDEVRAVVSTANADGVVTGTFIFPVSNSEMTAKDADALTFIADLRAAIEKVVADRINTLNGSTVVTYS